MHFMLYPQTAVRKIRWNMYGRCNEPDISPITETSASCKVYTTEEIKENQAQVPVVTAVLPPNSIRISSSICLLQSSFVWHVPFSPSNSPKLRQRELSHVSMTYRFFHAQKSLHCNWMHNIVETLWNEILIPLRCTLLVRSAAWERCCDPTFFETVSASIISVYVMRGTSRPKSWLWAETWAERKTTSRVL
jgi:hypothetical protein